MLFRWTSAWGEGQKRIAQKKGISLTLTMINMLVQERKGELESSGVWSGQECICVCGSQMEKCFMKGQPIGTVNSYHGAWQCLQRVGFPFCRTSRGLADPKDQDHGVINTPKGFWRGNSSTAFLLPPFLLCLTHRWLPPPPAHTTSNAPHDSWRKYCGY